MSNQQTEMYAKLDDDQYSQHQQQHQQGIMYTSVDTTGMNESGQFIPQNNQQQQQQQYYSNDPNMMMQQQQQQPTMIVSSSSTNPQQANNMVVPPTQQQQPQKSLLDSMSESFSSLLGSNVGSAVKASPQIVQPKYVPLQVSASELFQYNVEASLLDCQMTHPTQLGQVSNRLSFEIVIQGKTNPNLVHKVYNVEVSGNAAYRTDLKMHFVALDKQPSGVDNIDQLIQADPARSLDSFIIYVIVKKTKTSLIDVQKIPIAYTPCYTLSDFLLRGNTQVNTMFSFDLFKDQSLKEHVGKLGIRLSVTKYSDLEYIDSLPTGHFASKMLTVPCVLKNTKIANMLKLTENVKTWLNTYSSKITVISINTAHDGRDLVQIILYEKK